MVAEHHDGPVRDARRERLRQLLRAAPRRDSERLVAGKRWARPAAGGGAPLSDTSARLERTRRWPP